MNQNNNINNDNNVPNASNPPQASNKQFSSVFNPNQNLRKKKSHAIIKIICGIVLIILIAICIRWIYVRKKKVKVGYFYDENGNPEEKAKVVIIQ